MGTAFVVLVALMLLTVLLRRINPPPQTEAPTEEHPPAEGDRDKALAAAIAVSLTLRVGDPNPTDPPAAA